MFSKMVHLTLLFVFAGWLIASLASLPTYNQPPFSNGGLLPSSRVTNPNGSDSDQYVWDNFTLTSNHDITEIRWLGGFDPQLGGRGGPVVDFIVSIYPSIQGGLQPDVVNPPLLQISAGGDAGQAPAGIYGGVQMYSYHVALPAAFKASTGVTYWLQIEATQTGLPDWGILIGTGGESAYFRRYSNIGDIFYQMMHGADAAFTLLTPAAHAVWLPVITRGP